VRSVAANAGAVKDLVAEVRLASREQSRGIDQIATAISRISEVAQSTASCAEENAAASGQLTAHSQGIHRVMLRLRAMVEAR